MILAEEREDVGVMMERSGLRNVKGAKDVFEMSRVWPRG